MTTSKKTDLKQVPYILLLGDRAGYWKPGNINLDIGGGAADKFTDELAKRHILNLVYDPHNRSTEHNNRVSEHVVMSGGANTVTVSNVLNVIMSKRQRNGVIKQAWLGLKQGGYAYFTVYEGDRSGEGRKTTRGWQENRVLEDYITEIARVFHPKDIERRGPVIEARRG